MNYISFPGLGIEPFHIDKTAFTILGRDVAWYGIIITLGMILAVMYGYYVAAKRENLQGDLIIDLAFFVIVFGIIGARLYYVVFEWDTYVVKSGGFFENIFDTFMNIVRIWKGGLAIYGGILAGLLTAYVFARVKKVPFIKLFDILAPTVLIGQILGRWGNFVNMEAHGGETTLPWRMGLLYSYDNTGVETGIWDNVVYVHPTFLYESLWNLVGFLILHHAHKKKKFDGQMFAMYLIWYGFGRMLIEGLRTDSLMLGGIRISQWVGAVSCVIGIIIVIVGMRRKAVAAASEAEYATVYDALTEDVVLTDTNTIGEESKINDDQGEKEE